MAIITKSLQTINDGEGVEKKEPSYTAGENISLCSHYGEQYRSSFKKLKIEKKKKNPKNRPTIWSGNPTPGHVSGQNL